MKGSIKATWLVELLFCRQGGGFNLEWSYAKAAIEPKIEQNWSYGEMLRYEAFVIWYVTQRLVIHLRITGFFW